MSGKTIVTLALASVLSGCAGGMFAGPASPALQHAVGTAAAGPSSWARSARLEAPVLRRADDPASRLSSILLPPSAATLVAAEQSGNVRFFVGALFATHGAGAAQVADLALIVRAVGRGGAQSLVSLPAFTLLADGDTLIAGRALDPTLRTVGSGAWGPVETIMLPLARSTLKKLASAADARIVLGDSMQIDVAEAQRRGLEALIATIPEDTNFGLRPSASYRAFLVTQ